MDPNTQGSTDQTENIFTLVNECAEVIFDAVPVMMHSIDEEGIFLKVNPRWLSAMGYEDQKVLGHRFTDFLTEECRVQSLSDGLPLLWEARRVHSPAYRLLRKDGRLLYVALDAVVTPQTVGNRRVLGVFRKADDLVQWQWAKNSIKALQSLMLVQHGIERLFLASDCHTTHDQAESPQNAHELPWELLATIQDIADSLQVLDDLTIEDTATDQRHPHALVVLAEALQNTLAM